MREEFQRKRIMYVRNYGDGMGLPWQTVFQSEDRGEVEAYCAKIGIQAEWKSANSTMNSDNPRCWAKSRNC